MTATARRRYIHLRDPIEPRSSVGKVQHKRFYDFSEEHGCWIAVDKKKRIIWHVPANADHSRPLDDEVGQVTYVSDDPNFIPTVNEFFRMNFTVSEVERA